MSGPAAISSAGGLYQISMIQNHFMGRTGLPAALRGLSDPSSAAAAAHSADPSSAVAKLRRVEAAAPAFAKPATAGAGRSAAKAGLPLRRVERAARLYEQERGDQTRCDALGEYVRRWNGWACGGLWLSARCSTGWPVSGSGARDQAVKGLLIKSRPASPRPAVASSRTAALPAPR